MVEIETKLKKLKKSCLQRHVRSFSEIEDYLDNKFRLHETLDIFDYGRLFIGFGALILNVYFIISNVIDLDRSSNENLNLSKNVVGVCVLCNLKIFF